MMSTYCIKNMKLIPNKISEKATVKKHETIKNGPLNMKSNAYAWWWKTSNDFIYKEYNNKSLSEHNQKSPFLKLWLW